MKFFKTGASRTTVSSPFAEFIRNAKSDEKKRIYTAVITEATKQQVQVITAAKAQQA